MKIIEWLKKNKKTIIKISICSIVGLIVLPIIILGSILTIQGLKNEKLPTVFNVAPMVVITESMEPEINGGDLIFVRIVDASKVKEEDVISFWDPKRIDNIVTHRVEEKYVKDGKVYFKTKGDNNDSSDTTDVSEDLLIGIYVFKIPFVGKAAMFIQSTEGLIICLLIPLTIILSIDYFYRRKKDEEKDKIIEELKKEIEEFKK